MNGNQRNPDLNLPGGHFPTDGIQMTIMMTIMGQEICYLCAVQSQSKALQTRRDETTSSPSEMTLGTPPGTSLFDQRKCLVFIIFLVDLFYARHQLYGNQVSTAEKQRVIRNLRQRIVFCDK